MKNKYGNLKCEGCGFGCMVYLSCEDCERVYTICRTRDYTDVSDIADKEDKS